MSVRRFPEPESMRRGVTGTCKWCGRDDVKKPAIYWHRECADLYLLHTRPEIQKRFLLKRDGQRCAGCGAVPMKWLAGPVICITYDPDRTLYWGTPAEQAEWRALYWERQKGPWIDLTKAERDTGEHQNITRVCALEVDHRTPLWSIAHLRPDDRRPFFGPDNLWLLCPTCHKAKSRREAAERAAVRRAA